MICANLEDANFDKANLTGAEFLSANLHRANMFLSILHKADFRDANLKGANVSGATLECAILRDANLEETNLANTILTDADLERTNLLKTQNTTISQLERAKTLRAATLPDGAKLPDDVTWRKAFMDWRKAAKIDANGYIVIT